jgi:hypothetical protein
MQCAVLKFLCRKRQIVRIGAALAGGLLLKSLMDPPISIYRVKSLAALDSPMGGEMEALVREGDLKPEFQKYLLE